MIFSDLSNETGNWARRGFECAQRVQWRQQIGHGPLCQDRPAKLQQIFCSRPKPILAFQNWLPAEAAQDAWRLNALK